MNDGGRSTNAPNLEGGANFSSKDKRLVCLVGGHPEDGYDNCASQFLAKGGLLAASSTTTFALRVASFSSTDANELSLVAKPLYVSSKQRTFDGAPAESSGGSSSVMGRVWV